MAALHNMVVPADGGPRSPSRPPRPAAAPRPPAPRCGPQRAAPASSSSPSPAAQRRQAQSAETPRPASAGTEAALSRGPSAGTGGHAILKLIRELEAGSGRAALRVSSPDQAESWQRLALHTMPEQMAPSWALPLHAPRPRPRRHSAFRAGAPAAHAAACPAASGAPSPCARSHEWPPIAIAAGRRPAGRQRAV